MRKVLFIDYKWIIDVGRVWGVQRGNLWSQMSFPCVKTMMKFDASGHLKMVYNFESLEGMMCWRRYVHVNGMIIAPYCYARRVR